MQTAGIQNILMINGNPYLKGES